jgi:hypothetical protein
LDIGILLAWWPVASVGSSIAAVQYQCGLRQYDLGIEMRALQAEAGLVDTDQVSNFIQLILD